MTKSQKTRDRLLGSMTRHKRPNKYQRPVIEGMTRSGIILETGRVFVPQWVQWCDLKAISKG